jgi:hypothetical protein
MQKGSFGGQEQDGKSRLVHGFQNLAKGCEIIQEIVLGDGEKRLDQDFKQIKG